MHWSDSCPHTKEGEITLFAKDIGDKYIDQFIQETFNTAVLDSGCTNSGMTITRKASKKKI